MHIGATPQKIDLKLLFLLKILVPQNPETPQSGFAKELAGELRVAHAVARWSCKVAQIRSARSFGSSPKRLDDPWTPQGYAIAPAGALALHRERGAMHMADGPEGGSDMAGSHKMAKYAEILAKSKKHIKKHALTSNDHKFPNIYLQKLKFQDKTLQTERSRFRILKIAQGVGLACGAKFLKLHEK